MITKEQALEIARKECARRGWEWNEPVTVRWGIFYYKVWGGGRKGANLFVRIRRKTGEVVSVGMSPL